MDSRYFTPDAAAAAGLIIGIILGSLAVNLAGDGAAAALPVVPAQSAPRADNAGTGSVDISHR